ncbi:hypothetical protein FRB90_011245 [Tulasnella sp. 427]|nr:hypothetical protein FRB90_011245 [Tulasnella sp. 427]
MDRKRKWDQPGNDDESPPKVAKYEEKSATDAAAAAAAIAAKIAAQFAGPSGGSSAPGGSTTRDPHDAEFTHDIEINDVRNRYMLTKGATQQQILQETGASVTTKGIWYPDKSKATEKDPPLYLHISATTEDILKAAIEKVEDLINTELALTETRKREDERPRERRKWPDEKIFINLETLRNFNVRAKVVGPQGMFVKHIQSETGTRVQIKGQGSGFFDSETGRESDEPMHIHITGPEEHQIDRAKILTDDLLEVVRAEHAKAKAALYQQQMGLHQAQMYGAYGAYGAQGWGAQGGAAPPPPGDAPPPPPSDAPPPPPPSDGAPPPPPSNEPSYGANPSPQTGHDAFAQYWASQGYDVESEQFKQWMASQQQSYAQYYAAAGQQPAPPAGDAPPPPPSEAPPPPPPA